MIFLLIVSFRLPLTRIINYSSSFVLASSILSVFAFAGHGHSCDHVTAEIVTRVKFVYSILVRNILYIK